jgi:hypothetical protein
VRATVNHTSFPLIVVLAAIAAVTLVNVWRHAGLEETHRPKSHLLVEPAHPREGIQDSEGDPCR